MRGGGWRVEGGWLRKTVENIFDKFLALYYDAFH